MEYEIGEKELAPQLALTHRTPVTMATIADGIGGAFGVLMEHAGQTGAQWAGPPFILYPEICERRVRDRRLHARGPGRERRRTRRGRGGPRRPRARPPCTWARTARSARPTWRCRSG